ncbi:hypothetical protein M8J76_012002 [Diaphorina citri]|nr:hypothetical protein M8J76_012002 [Diaphorina citri]KAI5727687.1 hypothetical protein M8J77_005648 [Diaphorina citri]
MSIIIIYPTELYTDKSFELKGTVQFDNHCVYFYVLNNYSTCEEDIYSIGYCNNISSNTGSGDVSVFNSRKKQSRSQSSQDNKPYWVELTITDDSIDVRRLIINTKEFNVNNVDVTFVQYDRCSFLKSKLLNYNVEDTSPTGDCFQMLQRYVEKSYKDQSYYEHDVFEDRSQSSIVVVMGPLQKMLNICRFLKIFTFSSLYNQFTSVLENTLWCLVSIKAKKHKLKLLNHVTCILFDILVGAYLLNCFQSFIHSEDELFSFVSNKCESIVSTLHQLVVWLQGNPAGLKLNHPLTFLLGKFFIYHIQLWWSFLVLSRPLLELMYQIFLFIGYCGFTIQLCIISDLLKLASFHVYCIYVYAARLYNIQLQSLLILARVFIGKKRNPEPGKVDSVPYTTEQLFIGTIAFTVLLFLLPTTLVYYVVFTSIRLVIICVEGILNRIKSCFQTLPIFVAILYVMKSPQTTSTIKLTPQLEASGSGRVHILATPVQQSLLKTLEMTIPDPLNTSNPVPWSQVLTSVLTGKLVYPM